MGTLFFFHFQVQSFVPPGFLTIKRKSAIIKVVAFNFPDPQRRFSDLKKLANEWVSGKNLARNSFSWRYSCTGNFHFVRIMHEFFCSNDIVCRRFSLEWLSVVFFDTPELSKVVLPKVLQLWQSPFWPPTNYFWTVKESISTITQLIPDLTQTGYNEFRK